MSVLRVDARDPRVKKQTTVAGRLTFEFESKIKISVSSFRGQVAVLVGRTFTKYCSLVSNPFLLAIVRPARKILAIEKGDPSVFLGLNCGKYQENCDDK
jgi:hypothetical protein